MDPDCLKSIGWLLPWGIALFAVMRFGSGAHLTGGHGHHGERHDLLALELLIPEKGENHGYR